MTHVAEGLRARESVLIPVADIRRERMPWHVRVHIAYDEVSRLARAITATGEVVPIRVVPRSDGGYDLVSGMLRLLAVERLGNEAIPAFVDESADPEVLLRLALLEQEVRFPLRHLERGWALARLASLREARGLPHKQSDLVQATGLDKGTVSSALKASAVISEAQAEALAVRHAIGLEKVASLTRDQVRRIVGAGYEDKQQQALDATCAAIAKGENPASIVLAPAANNAPVSGTATAVSNMPAGGSAPAVAQAVTVKRNLRRWMKQATRRVMVIIRRALRFIWRVLRV